MSEVNVSHKVCLYIKECTGKHLRSSFQMFITGLISIFSHSPYDFYCKRRQPERFAKHGKCYLRLDGQDVPPQKLVTHLAVSCPLACLVQLMQSSTQMSL